MSLLLLLIGLMINPKIIPNAGIPIGPEKKFRKNQNINKYLSFILFTLLTIFFKRKRIINNPIKPNDAIRLIKPPPSNNEKPSPINILFLKLFVKL